MEEHGFLELRNLEKIMTGAWTSGERVCCVACVQTTEGNMAWLTL